MYQLVVVGHFTIDRMELEGVTRVQLGGPPAYAMVAPALGLQKVGVVSFIGNDFPDAFYSQLKASGLDLSGIRQEGVTTHFVNKYTQNGQRTQEVETIAKRITDAMVPLAFWTTRWMHISPVIQEVDYQIIKTAKEKGAKISVDVQGFLRKPKSRNNHRINWCKWPNFVDIAPYIDVLKADINEIFHLTKKSTIKAAASTAHNAGCGLILITDGQHGAYLFHDHKLSTIPAHPPRIVLDHTGSGDVFSISFLVEYEKTQRPLWAAFFASASASFNVETPGPTNFPNYEEVSQRLRLFLARTENRKFTEMLLDEPGPTDCPLPSSIGSSEE